jgi:transglutaminase-like putative cysteine protease
LVAPSLKFGPRPAWVNPIEAQDAPAPNSGGAIQVLLQDNQCRFTAEGTDCYDHVAVKALNATGMAAIGQFQTGWDPDTGSVTINRLQILRGHQVIDALNGGKSITVLRRETNLDRAALDGRLTATQQIEGVQVGDTLEIEVTSHSRDPALNGISERTLAFTSSSPTTRVHMRVLWPDSAPAQWRITPGLDAPKLIHAGGQTELVEDLANARAPIPPSGAPARFKYIGRLEVTQFANWSQVSQVMAPLFQRSEVLAADSPLKLEIAKISAASPSPKVRAALALALVQTKVRYEFVGLNDGGYVPATADQTWSRRYGDCKGKTALLLALLHGLGIEAQPVLVSHSQGDGLNERLPQLAYFDHVLVRAHIDGRWYWLDGVRPGDPSSIDDITTPAFQWGLPVQVLDGDLTRIDPPPPAAPLYEVTARVDASGGLQAPAPARLQLVYRGDQALAVEVALRSISRELADKALRGLLAKLSSTLDIKSVDWSFDPNKLVLTVTADGAETMNWRSNKDIGRNETRLSAGSVVSGMGATKRPPGTDQDAPYAAPYPFSQAYHLSIILPAGGKGFDLVGDDQARTLAASEFSRHASLKDGVAHLDTYNRTMAREYPASEIDPATEFRRQLNNDPILLRAPAGSPPA